MRFLTGTPDVDAEATLGVAAAGIQAIRAEVVPALIAAQHALAYHAFFTVMADRNVPAFHQVKFALVGERCFAGQVQRNHGKSIETWKLLTVAST